MRFQKSTKTRFLVLLLFGLGLRTSDTLGLKWRDFDFDTATAAIRGRWCRGDLGDEDETGSISARKAE
jgi:hypothetical protein